MLSRHPNLVSNICNSFCIAFIFSARVQNHSVAHFSLLIIQEVQCRGFYAGSSPKWMICTMIFSLSAEMQCTMMIHIDWLGTNGCTLKWQIHYILDHAGSNEWFQTQPMFLFHFYSTYSVSCDKSYYILYYFFAFILWQSRMGEGKFIFWLFWLYFVLGWLEYVKTLPIH